MIETLLLGLGLAGVMFLLLASFIAHEERQREEGARLMRSAIRRSVWTLMRQDLEDQKILPRDAVQQRMAYARVLALLEDKPED